jgi:hypothetical protein
LASAFGGAAGAAEEVEDLESLAETIAIKKEERESTEKRATEIRPPAIPTSKRSKGKRTKRGRDFQKASQNVMMIKSERAVSARHNTPQ